MMKPNIVSSSISCPTDRLKCSQFWPVSGSEVRNGPCTSGTRCKEYATECRSADHLFPGTGYGSQKSPQQDDCPRTSQRDAMIVCGSLSPRPPIGQFTWTATLVPNVMSR